MVTASPGNDSGAVSIYPHKSAVGIRRFGHSHRRQFTARGIQPCATWGPTTPAQHSISFPTARGWVMFTTSSRLQFASTAHRAGDHSGRAADAQPVAARANCTASLDRSNSESSLANCGPKNRATLYRAPNVLGTRCTRSSWRSSSPWSVILKSLVAKVIGWQRDAQ